MLDRIYVALDYPSRMEADRLLDRLPQGVGVKIGLELFLREGLSYVREIKYRGYNVFLDLKFHDIPRTVYGAVSQVADSCDLLNVHAAGGLEMLKAAKEASLKAEKPPKLIAVTVLTSLNQSDWQEIGGAGALAQGAEKRALLSREAGLDGVVCSPLEAARIKALCGEEFLTVTPGIRPQSAASQDQKRTATPREAVEMGCDYLVVGRPMTKAEDPARALFEIVEEMKS